MIRYYICNLENDRDFTVENVTFQRANNYKNRVRILRDEQRDQLTFYAIAPERKSCQPSVLFTGDNTTSVDDIMLLLSLAQSRNIYYPKAEDVGDTETHMWGMPLGGNRKANGYQAIMGPEIENFLESSLRQLGKPKWVEKTGFRLATLWWLESIYENRPLEIKFVSAFIALEVLSNAHANSQNIKNNGIRMRIEALAYSYGWNFMDRTIIKDWTAIRDKYMHAGTTISLKTASKDEIATRYFQLITSMQVILIDLLDVSRFARREYMISEIMKPIRQTYKIVGPYPIPT